MSDFTKLPVIQFDLSRDSVAQIRDHMALAHNAAKYNADHSEFPRDKEYWLGVADNAHRWGVYLTEMLMKDNS